MISDKLKLNVFISLFLLAVFPGYTQEVQNENGINTPEEGIQILQKYFLNERNWHVTRPDLVDQVNGLIHFIEDEPLDSVIVKLNQTIADTAFSYVYRLPDNVPDSLTIPGYYPYQRVALDIEKIGLDLQAEFQNRELTVPLRLITNIEEKVAVIKPGEGYKLFSDSIYTMPDSLKILDAIPDNMVQDPADFQRILKLDSIRTVYIEKKRIAYNDSLVNAYRDSVIHQYRQDVFEKEYNYRTKRVTDSVKMNNYNILRNYNNSVMRAVNDSISNIIRGLSEYADFIDTTRLVIYNLTDNSSEILLQNQNQRYARVWLKNEQQDSLSVMVKSTGKNGIKMLIDDGVTFSRFTPKKTRDFDFSTLGQRSSGAPKLGQKYQLITPWIMGGDGTVGFTQTYLENWKKGGESALSLLIVLKGFANYSRADGKIKWENSSEIRNGWIRPGGKGSELQKNDDKFEITSRFGVSAFKKWYYSAEFNYETQFFNGYKYPTSSNPDPISAFMAPARTFFKVGLDYKPNKEFSLFLSPLTIKNVYVRDTALIDQTKFGIDADKKSFWEPGLNADLSYKRDITKDISYETKYKMFINYQHPFSKFDINWENLVVMRLTEYINMRMMVHMIYDDDVLFPVYDENDVKIGEKPRLQLKQLITVGFSYKINRQVVRTRRI
jgi:hypothetical protein